MTLDDLVRMVDANGSGPWTQSASAILETLQQFVREGRYEAFSEGYRLALDAHPEATAFLSHAVVVMLLSEHKPLHEVATPAEFSVWCETNPGWLDTIRTAALDPDKIAPALAKLTASVQSHGSR